MFLTEIWYTNLHTQFSTWCFICIQGYAAKATQTEYESLIHQGKIWTRIKIQHLSLQVFYSTKPCAWNTRKVCWIIHLVRTSKITIIPSFMWAPFRHIHFNMVALLTYRSHHNVLHGNWHLLKFRKLFVTLCIRLCNLYCIKNLCGGKAFERFKILRMSSLKSTVSVVIKKRALTQNMC